MRILFVSNNYIGENCATGDMLNNLFSGFDDIKILQYILTPDYAKLDISNVSVLSHNDFNIFQRIITRLKASKYKSSVGLKFRKQAIRFNNYLNETFTYNISKPTTKAINDFNPEAIYTLGGDIKVLRMSVKIAEKLDIPIILHSMDDFYHFKFTSRDILSRIARKRFLNACSHAYRRCRYGLAIGPTMADEYSKEFGISFDWAMNCCSPDVTQVPQLAKSPRKIIFSGGLHGGRADKLYNFAEIIERTEYFMEIFTDNAGYDSNINRFEKFKNVSINRYVPKSEQIRNLRSADLLLHVESDDPKYIQYFRLSMSTKIPEYINAQIPILCIGSKSIASVSYIEQTHIGEVAENISDVHTALARLENLEFRKIIRKNQIQLLKERFSKTQMRKHLLFVLEQNISNK